MPWAAITIVIVVLLVLGLITYGNHVQEKKRTGQLQELAAQFGLDFVPGINTSLDGTLGTFSLFQQGRDRKAFNVLSGGTDEERLMAFDYRFVTGSGKQRQTHMRTVISFESTLLNVPPFELRPETFFDRVTEMFGGKEVDFDEYPEFSKRYHLTGSATRLRQVFNEPLVRKFESLRDVCAAGHGPRLIFYRASKRASVENFRTLLEDAYSIYALMKTNVAAEAESSES